MSWLQADLKKTKFIAYFFDGKEESAKEFCRKWKCTYVQDFLDKELTSIVLPDGKRCYAGNYIVIDGDYFLTYTKNDFMALFNTSTMRQHNYSFMTED